MYCTNEYGQLQDVPRIKYRQQEIGASGQVMHVRSIWIRYAHGVLCTKELGSRRRIYSGACDDDMRAATLIR